MKEQTKDRAGLDLRETEAIQGGGIIYVPVGGRLRQPEPIQQADLDDDGIVGASDFFGGPAQG